MSVIRVAHRRRFTSVSKETINDDRLSFRARGLLVWLLDKPNNWRADSTTIARATTEGREAIRTALRELEGLGYVRRTQRRGDRGRWVTETVIYERPQPLEDGSTGAQESVPGEPLTGAQGPVGGDRATGAQESGVGDPTPGQPTAGNLGALPLVGLRPKTENNPSSPRSTGTANGDGFEEFWAAYPKKVGKGAAVKAWPRAFKAAGGLAPLLDGVRRYADETDGCDRQFVANPASWLNGQRWTDEPGANRRSNGTHPSGPRRLATADEHGPSGLADPKDL